MGKLTGKKALVKVSGAPLTLTAEPTTDSGTHLVYQITAPAKRVLDPFAAISVFENGVLTTAPYSLNRLNGTVTFIDPAPIVSTMTVGDGSWSSNGTVTRVPAAFLCSDGTQLDLVGDNDVVTATTFLHAAPFTSNGSKDISFRIARSSAYAHHLIEVYDGTAGVDRLLLNIDFTALAPVVAVVSGTGTLVSVTDMGDGSYLVVATAVSVNAANVTSFALYPAHNAVTDTAQLYIGNLKIYDAQAERTAGVAVTVSGAYLPQTTAVSCNEWSLTLTGTNGDVSEFGDTFVERIPLFKDASGQVKSWRDSIDRTWENALLSGAPILLVLYTLSTGAPDFLLWVQLSKQQVQAALKSAQTQQIDFEGAGDAEHRVISAP